MSAEASPSAQASPEESALGPERALNSRGPAAAFVVACTNGPLLIRGDFELVGADGHVLPRTRRTVALCRCGASALKPYCDGSHKLTGFRSEP